MAANRGSSRTHSGNPTMQDVADLVGVSKQTISAVINNKPGITEETRARVRAAIDQLGYRIDHTARSLRTGRTHTIALLITDVSSPFLSKIALVAEDYAYAAQYSLMLFNTRDDPEREIAYANAVIQRSVDGVLFVSAHGENIAADQLSAAGVPIVAVDRVPQSYTGPSVTFNNRAAGRMAAEHLIGLGHQRMVHLAGPGFAHISLERLDGFRDVLLDHGCPEPVYNCAEGAWGIQNGYEAMQRILSSTADFTAVFAAGDQLAIGAMRALRESGRDIPSDVSLISIDDIDMAAFVTPSLTTISQSIPEMACQGVTLLLDLIKKKAPETDQIVIQPRLVARQSTAAPKQIAA
jgi:DNA-binding LacI/PurR family transcriptional regulator